MSTVGSTLPGSVIAKQCVGLKNKTLILPIFLAEVQNLFNDDYRINNGEKSEKGARTT